MSCRLLLLALRQMIGEVDVLLDMALQVHRHEGGELHEAGIDFSERALALHRHVIDQVFFEPVDRLALGELVDLGRLDPRVDRSGHQGQRGRAGRVVVLRHDGGCGQRRDRRLADRHHVCARTDLVEEGDQMVGVVLEPEAAGMKRNVARVMPVGDVDIVVLQQRLHGAAQQGGEMAGHRRHQQQPWLLRRILLLEVQERAERGGEGDFLGYLQLLIADQYPVDAVGRPMIGEGGARDQFERRGEPAKQSVGDALRHQIEVFQPRRGPGPPWRRQVHVVLVGLVHH